jgi:plasmid stability protein
MGVRITIRDVPDEVRDELASRAARAHKSLQEYLREELVRLASRASMATWLKRVRKRKSVADRRISSATILRRRNADRR